MPGVTTKINICFHIVFPLMIVPCSVFEEVKEKVNKEFCEGDTSAFCALMRQTLPAATQSTANVDREIICFHDYRLGKNKSFTWCL